MHQSKAENSHAGVSTFPPFKKMTFPDILPIKAK
jgi:hypothetical protein